jgi:hypothetical protein
MVRRVIAIKAYFRIHNGTAFSGRFGLLKNNSRAPVS